MPDRTTQADTRLRVLWIIPSLGGGGAEKHLLRLLNAFDRAEFAPALAVMRPGGSYERFLAEDVPVFALGRRGASGVRAMALAVGRLRRLIRTHQPAVVCAVLDHINVAVLVAVAGMIHKPAVVLCVQITPRRAYDETRSLFSATIRFAIRHWYHRADRLVVLSRGVARELIARNRRLSPITDVIPNAAIDDRVTAEAHAPVPREGVARTERLIVACGRLAPQKGFDVLLRAFALVRQSVAAQLWILGEGPERGRLVNEASRLAVDREVTFLGFQSEPTRFMAAADVFVLSSLFEGFGNVLVEAMSAGVPVVATDCPHGPGEIITHGVDGLLAAPGDANALAERLLQVLRHPATSALMAHRGRERSRAYHAARVTRAYEGVIRDVMSSRQNGEYGRPR